MSSKDDEYDYLFKGKRLKTDFEGKRLKTEFETFLYTVYTSIDMSAFNRRYNFFI